MVMSVATGVDVDVMGAKTLNVGGGDYIGEWQPRKSRNQNQKETQFGKMPTSEKWGVGRAAAMNVLILLGMIT